MLLNDASWLRQNVAERFLIFCKLERAAGAVPPGWDWPSFLAAAALRLAEPLDEEDASQRWGGENFFAGAFGGRSLRFTADVVYGFNYTLATHLGLVEVEARPKFFDTLEERIYGRLPGLLAAAADRAAGAPAPLDPAQQVLWAQLHSCRRPADEADLRMFDDVGGWEAWKGLLWEMGDPAEALGLIKVRTRAGGGRGTSLAFKHPLHWWSADRPPSLALLPNALLSPCTCPPDRPAGFLRQR
jgi:hypothetical protein